MARDSSTFKKNYNRALTLLSDIGAGNEMPTEAELAALWSTSRTTIRAILGELDSAGIIGWSGRHKTVLRTAEPGDYFPVEETSTAGDRLTEKFMDYLLTGEVEPGAPLHETDLVTRFGVSSTVVREFLIRFSRFGLIEKQRNRHWVLRGFTKAYATELFEVREMFEHRAFDLFLKAGPDSAAQHALIGLRPQHLDIIENIDDRFLTFPRLDEQFHRIWIEPMQNRFVSDFFELISLIFHYHYRWNKAQERDRNYDAATEHLRIIDAVAARDMPEAQAAFAHHLEHARETLTDSVVWDCRPDEQDRQAAGGA